MKRAFAVSLMVAVVATSLLGPAEAAKKKKPKPPAPAPVQADVSYFLRRDNADCADPAGRYLSVTDAEDIDAGSCGNNFYGVIDGHVEEQPATEYATREPDGVPVTLDATKDITGLIGVKSQSVQGAVRIGAGSANLHIELLGLKADGSSVTIGTADAAYQVVPGGGAQIYEVEFTMKPDAALDKVTFTSLTLSLKNTGDSVNHGYYTTDNPASYFKMGVWQ